MLGSRPFSLLFFVLTIFCSVIYNSAACQDLRLFQIAAPTSGCELSANENVAIVIINVGPVLNNATFDAAYSLNGAAPVVENIVLPPVFNNGSLITYTFSQPADLSIPGTFSFDSYINLSSDVNRSNDTVNNYIVVSDPATVAGTLSGAATVCSGSNNGYLVLSGTTGSITGWQQSPNGTSWTNISNTNDSLQYINLTSSTYYRAIVKSGSCPQQFSSPVLITVDQPSVAGSINGTAAVCSGASGTLNLAGETGLVVEWSSSTNGGSTWTPIANTSTSHSYTNLTVPTIFRVEVKNGTCPSAFATFSISLIPPSVGGTLSSNDTVCSGTNSGTINLSGNTGNVVRWERSFDGGATWSNISNTNTSLIFSNLTTTTTYRAVVLSCSPEAFSSTVTIVVNQPPAGGTLSGAATVCSGNNSGSLTLTGSSGSIQWQSSSDGISWTAESGTTGFYTYSNLTDSTYFRVKTSSKECSDDSSNVILISVDPSTDAGNTSGDTTVCILGNSGQISLSQYIGQILQWESSTDNGANWNVIANTSSSISFSSLSLSTQFRALVKSGTCNSLYSDTSLVTVTGAPMSGTITGNDTVCAGSDADLLLTGSIGSTISWESSSPDSLNWQPLSFTTSAITLSGLSVTTYVRAIVSNGGCGSDTSLPFKIEVVSVTANAGRDTSISVGSSVTLNGAGGILYLWSPALDLSATNIFNPVASPAVTTSYQLEVTGMFGCQDVDSVTITVIETDTAVSVTNFISSNGDGINDTWVIRNIEDHHSHVLVFNGNGAVVFEAENYLNSWDATYNGTKIPDGTYYYVVEIKDSAKAVYKGNLTVVSK